MKTLIGIIVLIAIVWGGWYYMSHRNADNDTMMSDESTVNEDGTMMENSETMMDGDESTVSGDASVTGEVNMMTDTK